MKPLRTSLLIILVSLCLVACGFRLAGTAELPAQLSSIYLQTSNFSNTQRKALQRSLKKAGAKLVDEGQAGAARLSVSLNSEPDQQLATSASSGDIVRRISRSLDFNVKGEDGSFLIPPRTLKQQKDVSLDENNLLASNRERDSVALEIEQALYDQLIRQLSRI